MTYYNDKPIYRAAMVPYVVEDGQIWMLFQKPSDPTYGGDSYQLAKGKVEEGETAEEAAVREAQEEVGLFRGNVVKGPEHVGLFLGRTDVYVCKVKDRDLFGLPSDETESTKWMTLEDFLNEGRLLHKPVVQACIRAIERLETQD